MWQKFKKNMKKASLTIGGGACMLHYGLTAPRAANVGDVAKDLTSQTTSILDLIKNGTLIAGICLFAVGVIKITRQSDGRESGMGPGLKFIIAGTLLGAIGAIMKISGSSLGVDEGQFSSGQGWN